MIPTITIVAEQQLVVILRITAHRASFTLNAQPLVVLHGLHYLGSKSQTRHLVKLLCTLGARYELFIRISLATRLMLNAKTHLALDSTSSTNLN